LITISDFAGGVASFVTAVTSTIFCTPPFGQSSSSNMMSSYLPGFLRVNHFWKVCTPWSESLN
jgi:hypothetical protein